MKPLKRRGVATAAASARRVGATRGGSEPDFRIGGRRTGCCQGLISGRSEAAPTALERFVLGGVLASSRTFTVPTRSRLPVTFSLLNFGERGDDCANVDESGRTRIAATIATQRVVRDPRMGEDGGFNYIGSVLVTGDPSAGETSRVIPALPRKKHSLFFTIQGRRCRSVAIPHSCNRAADSYPRG